MKIPRNPSRSTDSFFVETFDNGDVFSFAVKRKSTGQVVWDTSIGMHLIAFSSIAKVISVASLDSYVAELSVLLRYVIRKFRQSENYKCDSYFRRLAVRGQIYSNCNISAEHKGLWMG